MLYNLCECGRKDVVSMIKDILYQCGISKAYVNPGERHVYKFIASLHIHVKELRTISYKKGTIMSTV